MVGRIPVLERWRLARTALIGPLPYVAAFRHARRPVPRATLIGVYRARNADRAWALVSEAAGDGIPSLLWALDEPDDRLRNVTLGSGPGSRFRHLNALAERVPHDCWLLIADDDVRFCLPRALRTALRVAVREGLDLSQPAHAGRSNLSHEITRQRRHVSVRETTFVEIGPVLLVSPAIRDSLIPFPGEGMGWGLELEWYGLRARGFRLGIIDCVPLVHLEPVATTYEVADEVRAMNDQLARHGLSSILEIQQTIRSKRLA
jgi:hypothetical protein